MCIQFATNAVKSIQVTLRPMLIMATFDMITGACTGLNGAANLFRENAFANNDTIWAPTCYAGVVRELRNE